MPDGFGSATHAWSPRSQVEATNRRGAFGKGPVVRAVVTVLHAPAGAAAAAAAATVDYVSGSRQALLPSPGDAGSSGGVVGYFADQTPEGPGRWLGAGAARFGLRGGVERDDLEALLRSEDPRSGAELVPARGSNRRSRDRRAPAAAPTPGWDQAHYTIPEASAVLGVSEQYLRKIAGRTRGLLARSGGDGETLRAVLGSRAFLVAEQGDDARWRVTRDELLRFAQTRRAPSVVIGFDVTFSVPKSVSLLWARADGPTRTVILAAFGAAVDAGVEYLECHGAVTGRGEDRVEGQGVSGAAFTHVTSRALDPQVHAHVVIANVTERPDGSHRALDGRGLFEHAKTAAYLAGAQLRHELTERLGVGWRFVRSGIAEIDGVPKAAIDAMSSRRAEIDDVAGGLDVTSAMGRRALALRTRTPKQVESLASLGRDWNERLDEAGFGPLQHAACLGHSAELVEPTAAEVAALFTRLVRHDGLTAHTPTFTRQEVIQALADWSLARVDAAGIEELAETFLRDPRVLPLEPSEPAAQAGTGDRQRAVRPREPQFTTGAMVRAERRVLDGFRSGVRAAPTTVGPGQLGDALAAAGHLGEQQRNALEQLYRSPHRVQCLVGPAGSGKTQLLGVAASVWSQAGCPVRGVAVQGTAAENLEHATGIPSQTLASFLAATERDGPATLLTPGTVVVLDEASAVGTFDLARLFEVVDAASARVVLVGDPAQHGSVSAGGGFATLTRRWRHLAAQLSDVYRQDAVAMQHVRVAVDDLRRRDTDSGLHRLVVDDRVGDAATRVEAYDAMVRDWASDRARAGGDGAVRRVCMITEDHRTRRALIARARAHLQSTGDLFGPVLRVGEQEFQAGDEVIARTPLREVHPPGAATQHVRNGTCGRVVAVPDSPDAPGLWVDFDRRGVLFVPDRVLREVIRPGTVGALTHSYALTSHAAQGATYDVARMFATEATGPAALYVGASRAREDLRIYTAPHREHPLDEAPQARVVSRDAETGLQSLARAVRQRRDECFAIDRDPTLLNRLDTSTRSRPGEHRLPVAPTAEIQGTELGVPSPAL